MMGVSRVLPSNAIASPTKPGASVLTQFGLLLQLSSAPRPFQISLVATIVSAMLPDPVNGVVSVA